jgi:Flp pilus assembly pilin Flp
MVMRKFCRSLARNTQSDERAIAYGGLAVLLSVAMAAAAHFVL